MRGQRLPDDAISFLSFLDEQLSQGRQHRGPKCVRGTAHSAKPSVGMGKGESPRNGHVEEALMRKHRQAQSKLTILKAQKQCQELHELQASPTINPLSRKLAESMPRPQLYPPSVPRADTKAKKIPIAAKPIESDPTISVLTVSKSEGLFPATHPAFQLRCHVNLEEGTTSPVFPAIRAGKEQDLRVGAKAGIGSIESLRKEVMEKYRDGGKLEPPPDILEMPVLARQDYFLEQRSRKLQHQRDLQAQAEANYCTFRPQLTAPRSLSASRSEKSYRSLSAPRRPNSYYERYVRSKLGKESRSNSPSNIRSESLASRSRRTVRSAKSSVTVQYFPISPTQQRIGFKSGMNISAFLSSAKPMVSYRNVDIKKAMEMPRASRHSQREKRG